MASETLVQEASGRADVLVIGGGVAGMRAALAAAEEGARVLIVTKDSVAESATLYAQGGVAAVLGDDDSLEAHRDDTLAAGDGLCEARTVEEVVADAPDCIRELMGWGGVFDRDGAALHLGREGGHSRHRIVHAGGDSTGKEVVSILLRRVQSARSIEIREFAFAEDLAVDGGRCVGAFVRPARSGARAEFLAAPATILCTGGAGQVYRETTNPGIATGDGLAMAYRAGVPVGDVEFVQFHPTSLYVAGAARHLITEAVRGEGAWLVDDEGSRFVFQYDPAGELAPRDRVSRAIVQHIARTGRPCVYLDLRHLGPAVRERFPGLNHVCALYGLDVGKDRIPVHPSAHYMVGGCFTDLSGRTAIPGLYAAGEVALTGLHGANRLASNSLLEGLVFGRRAGRTAAAEPKSATARVGRASPDSTLPSAVLNVADMLNSIRSLLWRSVGIIRRGEGLEEACRQLRAWSEFVAHVECCDTPGWELRNLLVVALLVAEGARWREESRGAHFREDHPVRRDPDFRCHSEQVLGREPHGRPLR
jgi:L-aspartate oxidase